MKKREKAPHDLNKVQDLDKCERTTTTKLPKVVGPQSEPDRCPRFIKPQHLHYYYHYERFSHLLTSTRLMIIAKEEITHNIQVSESVS